MDPLHTVQMEKDTTFLLMLGAHHRSHEVYFLADGKITMEDAQRRFHVVQVVPQLDTRSPFVEKSRVTLREDEIDVLFIRTDPPFDYGYLTNTWLLDGLAKKIPVINHPVGLRTVNEKIWTTQFTQIIPPTLVGRERQDCLDFLAKHRDCVAKPTDGHGGKAVFHLQQNDKNVPVILETLSNHYSRDIIMQAFIPDADKGDKRILLLNGEPLGAVLRMHAEDDHRNNFFSGGKPLPAKITPRDLLIIDTLKPELERLGLFFVGIDILGDYLIEVNVTSPTCLQEMNRFANQHLEDQVMAFAENLVAKYRTGYRINIY
jgi:glutathione synthase